MRLVAAQKNEGQPALKALADLSTDSEQPMPLQQSLRMI
jgi:hypothetical protein